jgi:hypothetical protein
MSPRVTPLFAVLALALAACTGATAPTMPSRPSVSPVPTRPVASPAAAPTGTPAATASADSGNVNAPGTPDLSIEPVGAQAIRVTLVNLDAKAWSVSVAGTGNQAADAWILDVETGDVGPVITTTEAAAGVAGDPVEQPGLEAGDPAGRVCSTTLPVCVVAKSIVLPDGGNGTLVLELLRTDTSVALAVSAATATWPTDPFVLGPWTTTEAFPWGI